MGTGLFDSTKGNMIHYFIRPNDAFILNSLEKLDADEYLYRLLREEGYESVFFIGIDGTNCKVWAYDEVSYWASVKPQEFSRIDTKDPAAVAEFLRRVKGGGQTGSAPTASAPAKPGLDLKFKTRPATGAPATPRAAENGVPAVGRCQMQTFSSDPEFASFMINRINPALRAENIKTAIVMPVELFEKRNYLGETIVDHFRSIAKDNDTKDNLIILTTTHRDNLMNCYNYPNLHYWVPEILSGADYQTNRVSAAVKRLTDEGVIVLADKICADEIANLLIRKKIIECDSRFDGLSLSKVYALAELLAEHCNMKETHFKTMKPFMMRDYIRQLDKILKTDAVAAELVEKSKTLKARKVKALDELSPVRLERVVGEPIERFEISQEERLQDYRNAMAELDSMIGLSSVKNALEDIFAVQSEFGASNGPGHYIFAGNPGTGKTVVARLMGEIFKSMGLVKNAKPVECKAADLVAGYVGQSSIKTREKCEEALDGVLFVDEAYELVNTDESDDSPFPSDFAKDAYTEIMTFMENNSKRICVIFAGYEDKMVKFKQANPGMESRITETIHFPDYSDEELYQIFKRFAGKDRAGFSIRAGDEPFYQAAIRKVKSESDGNFGNGREMRNLFEECKKRVARRISRLRMSGQRITEAERFVLTAEDIPEKYAVEATELEQDPESEYRRALETLNSMIGLQSVKNKLEDIFTLQSVYGATNGPGHYIFAGNPGTGKTAVARLMGRILKAMGLIKKSKLVECKVTELVAGHLGQTAMKTRKKCEEALDGVLFVDEAYQLVNTDRSDGSKFASEFAEEAYTEIMTFMENNAKRICVIFAGYTDKMEKFKLANPGMKSRITDTIIFPDYDAEELYQIFKRFAENDSKGFDIREEDEDLFRETVRKIYLSRGEEFGNGREMRTLFDECKTRAAKRVNRLILNGTLKQDEDKYILTAEDIPEKYGVTQSDRESTDAYHKAIAELNEMIGLRGVKHQIGSLANNMRYPADPGEKIVPGHYVFAGNPGTGKTVVARMVARILKSIGILSKTEPVEVSRGDLVAGYVGQTAIKTMEKCKEALGGVLFVDEAYTLFEQEGSGANFGREALETIMKFMEDNNEKICVIFAGYEDRMNQLMEVNAGFASRITEVIRFEDYSLDELVQILELMATKKRRELSPDFIEKARAQMAYWLMHKTSGFGNGRDVRKLLDKANKNRGNRIANAIANGADPASIQMNLLVAEDLDDLPMKTPDGQPDKPNQHGTYHKISGDLIRNLTPCYGPEATASRKALAAATDSSVLYVRTNIGSGTAFLISPDGYALTCNHVIEGATEITARLRIPGRPGGDDSFHKCSVINTRKDLDIALIKLEGSSFPYLKLATVDREIQKGEEFILSGYPFGERTVKDMTMYNGYVASSDRQCDENGFTRYNINCEAKSGDSGAPIISLEDGCVIG
ncbi:MAG: AAA family ATPase, partial [Lachnospiraceae bacterium]|nr:AAA family ATPase [Lachnospiraceae bacterium]